MVLSAPNGHDVRAKRRFYGGAFFERRVIVVRDDDGGGSTCIATMRFDDFSKTNGCAMSNLPMRTVMRERVEWS